MGLIRSYRLRLRRRRWLVRAFLRRRQLVAIRDRTKDIRQHDILLICCLRNERVRLAYFMKYYRDLGVNHFLFVDNASDDGTCEWLAEQPDASVWSTTASYKSARYGLDWQNWLLRHHGHNHWCLTVDPDEFLVYPFCDTRPLRAMTDWLEASGVRAFSAMILDMYPKGAIDGTPYREGQDPLDIACWFDSGNYTVKRNPGLGNLWIQGGPRARAFFADRPDQAPALNKIPLVKWHRSYAYESSTHMLLPRGLNLVYDDAGGEKASGCLLHMKLLDTLTAKAEEEMQRGQHFAASVEYKAYREGLRAHPDLWCKWSERYINWRQLEILGLMSKGNWA